MKSATRLSDRFDLQKEDVFDLKASYMSYLKTAYRKSDRGGVFHPSALGMCGRRNSYEYLRYPHNDLYLDVRTAEIFEFGHLLHGLVQGRLSKLPIPSGRVRVLNEVPTPKGDQLRELYSLAGTSDSLLELVDPTGTQRGILEIKSIGIKGVEEVRATGPKLAHLYQIHIYMYRFDCPVGWVFYYCKDNSEIEVFPVVFDDNIFQEALDKVMQWKRLADAGDLPEREESWFGCKECPYRDTCRPSILERRRKSDMTTLRKKNAKARSR